MSEDIKALIEKINREGIAAAQVKAKEIEDQAMQKSAQILEKAKREVASMLNDAKEQISRMRDKQNIELAQAGRDLLLSLRQEINTMLERLILKEVKDSLNPESIFKLLSSIAKSSCSQEKTEITVSLNKEDLKVLESSFLAKLKAQTQKEIILRSSDTIQAGFVISFDKGKSEFDFSDKALADHIANFLKPKLKEILQG